MQFLLHLLYHIYFIQRSSHFEILFITTVCAVSYFSEPPCTKAIEDIPTLLISGVPRPVPGFFVPKCNEDGFYLSKQCHRNECFCVDRNGIEVAETRVNGTSLQCRKSKFIFHIFILCQLTERHSWRITHIGIKLLAASSLCYFHSISVFLFEFV